MKKVKKLLKQYEEKIENSYIMSNATASPEQISCKDTPTKPNRETEATRLKQQIPIMVGLTCNHNRNSV